MYNRPLSRRIIKRAKEEILIIYLLIIVEYSLPSKLEPPFNAGEYLSSLRSIDNSIISLSYLTGFERGCTGDQLVQTVPNICKSESCEKHLSNFTGYTTQHPGYVLNGGYGMQRYTVNCVKDREHTQKT